MRVLVVCTLIFVAGCFDDGGSDDHVFVNESPAPERPAPEAATPPAISAAKALTCLSDKPDEVRAIQRVRQVAEASVHELVTCGGAQLQISASFVARVLLSNPQFFDEETLDTLSGLLGFSDIPFEHTEDGRWRMPLNGDSSFDLRFMLPGSDVTETANVFDLGSYLTDAKVETSLSFEEMLNNFDAKNEYRISWVDYGPLADVMFPDGRPEEQVFVVEASLTDLAYLAFGITENLPDFGPFESLPDLEIESNVDLLDSRDNVKVTYSFGGQRQSLGHFHTKDQVAFELRSLAAEGEGIVLQGEAADLRVLGRGSLAGPLVYAVDGVSVDGIRVVDDFGSGMGYPEASYWCPDDWKESPHAEADLTE